MKRNMVLFLAPLVLVVIAAAGCSHQTAEQEQAKSIGAEMQKSGTMSQKDYVQLRSLGHQVGSTHAISDADLDWDLAFLKRSDNGIARARALTVISEINPLSSAQRAKISPIVTPYLTSPDALTRQSALRVQRHGGLL
jgi:hypothetical protein